MLRTHWSARVVFSVAAGAMLALNAATLNADSFGSWGSSGGSSGGSWGGRPGLFNFGSRGGPVRNLLGRVHDRLHYGHASSGGSRGGSSGGWGSSGGSWGSSGGAVVGYASSGGSWGSSGGRVSWSGGSSGYTPVYSGYGNWTPQGDIILDRGTMPSWDVTNPPTPAAGEQGNPIPAPSDSEGGGTTWRLDPVDGVFVLQVHVPEDAQVFVNGRPTRSTGTVRRYVARRLSYDREYEVEVKAVVYRNGRELVRSEIITSRAGEQQDVQLSFDGALPPPTTSVTLNVPGDARVLLAGVQATQTGPSRVFSTTSLADGESWDDYRIVVEIERDGQLLTQEKVLDIHAGQSYDLTFDFRSDATRVATR